MSAAEVLERLERVQGREPQWLALCPAHDDRAPSLSIREAEDGRILLHCHAGCSAVEVIDALGLEWADLFPEGVSAYSKPQRQRWDYRLLLCSLNTEAVIVQMAANELLARRPLEPEDHKRLKEAARRIAQIAQVAR